MTAPAYRWPMPTAVRSASPETGALQIFGADGQLLGEGSGRLEDSIATAMQGLLGPEDVGREVYVWTRTAACVRLWSVCVVGVAPDDPEGPDAWALSLRPIQILAPLPAPPPPPEDGGEEPAPVEEALPASPRKGLAGARP